MYVISHSAGLEGLLSVTHYSRVVCQRMGWMSTLLGYYVSYITIKIP